MSSGPSALLRLNDPAWCKANPKDAGKYQVCENPQLNAEYKLLLKDSPNFIDVGKGEDKLRAKVNDIIAAGKASGDLDKMAVKWLGRPAGDLPN